MTGQIKRATKRGIALKAILAGVPGSGKTYTGLRAATRIARHLQSRLLVIDTEGGQSQTYADAFDFDVLELDDHAPKSYVDAIKAGIEAGYQIVLVDSFSHEWNGTNGILQQVGRERNKFSDGWGTATPLHDRFVQYLVHAPIHIFGTVRQKIVHVQEDEVSADGRKRTVIRKLGEQDQQRDTFLYELAWHGVLDQQHTLTIDKSRYGSVPLLRVGQTIQEPGAELADAFLSWLDSGGQEQEQESVEVPASTPAPAAHKAPPQQQERPTEPLATDEQRAALRRLRAKLGPQYAADPRQAENNPRFTATQAESLIQALTNTLAQHQRQAAAPATEDTPAPAPAPAPETEKPRDIHLDNQTRADAAMLTDLYAAAAAAGVARREVVLTVLGLCEGRAFNELTRGDVRRLLGVLKTDPSVFHTDASTSVPA